MVAADGGQPRQLTTSEDPCRDLHAAWAPDGSQIAFDRDCTVGGDPGIYVVDVATGQLTQVVSENDTLQGLSWSPDGEQPADQAS